MNRMNGPFLAIIACAVLAVIVFFLIDFAGERVFATPQEAFDASRVALKKNDMRGWCQCLTDDSRDFIAASMAVQEFMSKQAFEKAGGDEKKAQIRAVDKVFAKHGLTEESLATLQGDAEILGDPCAPMKAKLLFAQEVLKPVGDRCLFVADMFEAVLKGRENPFHAMKDDKLSEVKISGKVAMGIVTSRLQGQERAQKMFFRKQGEGWRIDMFVEEEQRPMRPPGMPPGHP